MNWGVNMDKVYIGKVVSTHGIKGEIRILSDFPYKKKVFKVGNKIIIDNKEYEIKTYRVHKNFDMVTLDDYNNINDILFLMNKYVYFDKDLLELSSSEILDEDLINFKVITEDGTIGTITEIFYASPTNKILRVMLDKEILVPYNSPMIKKIDKDDKSIIIELINGI